PHPGRSLATRRAREWRISSRARTRRRSKAARSGARAPVPRRRALGMATGIGARPAFAIVDLVPCRGRRRGARLRGVGEPSPHREGQLRRRSGPAAWPPRGRTGGTTLLPELRQVPRRDHAVPPARRERARAPGDRRSALVGTPPVGAGTRARTHLRLDALRTLLAW